MKRRAVAGIDETRCIGCARCIAACPVDAIAGAQGFMHTVISAYCIGCELCLPPCPVDCIEMLPPAAGHAWGAADARAAQGRYRRRVARIVLERAGPAPRSRDARRATIAASIARAAARRGGSR